MASEQDTQNVDAIVDAVVARLQTHTTEPRTRRNALKYGLAGVGALAAYLVGQGIPPAQAARIATGYIDQIGRIDLDLGSAPGTPASGVLSLYGKSSDKRPYAKDSDGNEISLDVTGHAGLTATHGASDIADVSDIAVDGNLSAAAQAAIAASHAAVTVAGAPLTLAGQQVTFNKSSSHFDLSGNDLILKALGHGSAQHLQFKRFLSNTESVGWTQSSSAFTADGRVWVGLGDIPWACTIDYLFYMVLATSAGNIRIALYGPVTPVSGAPPEVPTNAPLLVESTSVAQPGTNRRHFVSIADTAITTPGLYFGAIQSDGTTGTFARSSVDDSFMWGGYFPNGGGAGAYGAFQNPMPAITAANALIFGVRVKSTP